MLIKLKDGGILDIHTDETTYKDVYDYSQICLTYIEFKLTKYKVILKPNRSYNYSFTSGDLMKLILSNLELLFVI